jgi:hypothetical protein
MRTKCPYESVANHLNDRFSCQDWLLNDCNSSSSIVRSIQVLTCKRRCKVPSIQSESVYCPLRRGNVTFVAHIVPWKEATLLRRNR